MKRGDALNRTSIYFPMHGMKSNRTGLSHHLSHFLSTQSEAGAEGKGSPRQAEGTQKGPTPGQQAHQLPLLWLFRRTLTFNVWAATQLGCLCCERGLVWLVEGNGCG